MAINFPNWFNTFKRKSPAIGPENVYNPVVTTRDYSDVGVDSSFQKGDMLAATGLSYPTVVGSNSVTSMGGFFGGYFSFSGWQGSFPLHVMHSLVRLYLWMGQDPDIRYAIDEIVNEAVSTAYNNDIVKIDLDSVEMPKSIKERISDEFGGILDMMEFKRKSYYHFSDFYTNGRIFYKLDVSKKNAKAGIKGIKNLSPFDVIAYFDGQNNVFRDPESVKIDFKRGYVLTENAFRNAYYLGMTNPAVAAGTPRMSNYYVAVPEELVVYQHTGLSDWRSNVPISYLHLVLRTLNQLRNLRDAMIIYRMTRAPERFVFNVEVGKMQAARAQQYVAEVASKLKQTISYVPETGQFKDMEEKLQIYKDWYFPKVDGKGTDVDVLQSGNMQGQLEEVQAIRKDLFMQLFIPPNRYIDDHSMMNFGSMGDMEKSEVKFFKFISRLQLQYSSVFYDMLRMQLSMKNIMTAKEFDKIKGSIKFSWGSENVYSEARNFAVMQRKASVLGQFENYIGSYGISEDWITKNVMGFTDEEIKDNESTVLDSMKKKNYRDRIKNGQILFDENGKEIKDPYGTGGGGMDASGGGEAPADGEEVPPEEGGGEQPEGEAGNAETSGEDKEKTESVLIVKSRFKDLLLERLKDK